jgi:hypothetical protein
VGGLFVSFHSLDATRFFQVNVNCGERNLEVFLSLSCLILVFERGGGCRHKITLETGPLVGQACVRSLEFHGWEGGNLELRHLDWVEEEGLVGKEGGVVRIRLHGDRLGFNA